MRIVIVDDSDRRVGIIKAELRSHASSSAFQVVRCSSADEGRRALLSACDLLILDLVLPKKLNTVAQAEVGLALLEEVCNPEGRYIRPRLIVGLTADTPGLGHYQVRFAKHASIVLDGDLKKLDWLAALMQQIASLAASERKLQQQARDRVLISVHGIRTNGTWQQLLSERIGAYSRSYESIEIKYGFVDILSFCVPQARKRVVRRMAAECQGYLQDHADKDVYVVAHSFGTMIVYEALKGVDESRKKIKGIIFSGSPLPHNCSLDHVVSRSERTVNDCGIWDVVLVFARLLVLGLGDAGRIGFTRANSDSFINRYFRGGHSVYFGKSRNGKYFFERYWFDFLVLDTSPRRVDYRGSYPGRDLVHLLLGAATRIKPLLYLAAGGFLFWLLSRGVYSMVIG